MACIFINVKSSAACTENFSGVGSKFYVFSGQNITETEWNDVVAEATLSGYINAIKEVLSKTTLYQVDIKPKSGKVTATSNPNGGGFSNVFTGVVAHNMQKMTELARSLNNDTDWGVIVPSGGKYYVLYDKNFGIEFSMESDSGDTPDSDHGHTVTITCSPMLYAMPQIDFVPSNYGVDVEKATVAFSATGTTITAKNMSTNASISTGASVAIGTRVEFTTVDNVTWPNGVVGNTYSAIVDENGVNVSVSKAG